MPSKATINLSPAFLYARTFGDDTQVFTPRIGYGDTPWQLTEGTGALQYKRLFTRKITLTGSEQIDLDLNGDATFKDPHEQPINFVKVKGLWLFAKSTNVHPIHFGPAAANGFMGPWLTAGVQQKLEAGQPWVQMCQTVAGWPVTAGTADLFRILNSGATTGQVVYVMVWGDD